jgi:beta-xylosidase
MGDPFVVRYGKTYYLTGTTDAGKGFRLWSSSNLVDWKPRGFAYTRGKGSWGERSFWAPELFRHRNRYYLVYSANRKDVNDGKGGFRICLAVADRPAGPYRDLYAPWCDPGYSCIDGHVFIDSDGTAYLYLAKVGVIRKPKFKLYGAIHAVRLKGDLSGPAGEPVLCTKADQPWETPAKGRSLCNEGAFVLRRDGRYYMTYSANHYAEPFYGIGYATAASPLGPWRKAPDNPLLRRDKDAGVSGPGHCSITTSPDGRETFIVYHAHADPDRPSGRRTVNIDRLILRKDGGLKVIGPTRSPQPRPSGAGREREGT